MTTTWRFEAFDTWFFRESRPFGSIGDAELSSTFPPPARTLAGAVRTCMGEAIGVDWSAFVAGDGSAHRLEQLDFRREIGFGADLGNLRLAGPWLTHRRPGASREPIFPAPLLLLGEGKPGERRSIQRLRIGLPRACDLGRVRLPQSADFGMRPLLGSWLGRDAYERVLAGGAPALEELIERDELLHDESRLGIERSHAARTSVIGMLYQLRHVRPASGLAVEIGVSGVDSRLATLTGDSQAPTSDPDGSLDASSADSQDGSNPRRSIRLGGEGRLASVSIRQGDGGQPTAPSPLPDTRGLILMLLTRADLGARGELPGFTPGERDGARVWHGEIASIPLTLHCAVLGRAERLGGWDLATKQPSPVRSFVPAGSAWYCTVRDDRSLSEAIQCLHGAQVGEGQALGLGRLAVALWPRAEFLEETHA